MSSDFFTNKRRVDIVTGCKPEKGIYRSWYEVIKAILTGEKVIRTTMKNRTKNKYDPNGRCIFVGCYENKLCKLLREHGITNISYGSPTHWLNTRNDTYTVYLPKSFKRTNKDRLNK